MIFQGANLLKALHHFGIWLGLSNSSTAQLSTSTSSESEDQTPQRPRRGDLTTKLLVIMDL